MSEPQPKLKLAPRRQPFQKITISRMPISLHRQLRDRAGKINKRVPVYCRIVLEHALSHKKDYEGPLRKSYENGPCYRSAVTIPIVSKNFMERLVAWDPFGDVKRTRLAMSILKKHLEVRTW